MSTTNEYHFAYAGHHYFIGHAKKYPLLPYALDGLGLYRKQGYINRPDGIESYQWTQCVSGTGEFFYNNKVFTITPAWQSISLHISSINTTIFHLTSV